MFTLLNYLFIFGFANIPAMGIGGDTGFVLLMDTFGMWTIGVPAGFFTAFVLKLSFPVVYRIITLEEVVRMILMYKRTRSGKWLNNLVEEL